MSDASIFANKHSGKLVHITIYGAIRVYTLQAKVVGWRDSSFFTAQVLLEPPEPDLGDVEYASIRDRTNMTSVLGYHWLFDVDRFVESPPFSLTLVEGETYVPDRRYPHICGECKQPAQLLFQFVDCSNYSCRHYRR